MLKKYRNNTLPFNEFIGLMAMVMSLVALSIDSILPALSSVGESMGNSDPNDNQLVISFLLFGLACGQLIFGPWSDAIGRRKAMLAGYSVFFVGTILALTANDFNTLLLSRFLQGFGLSAPKVLSMAIVRDLYQGRVMAKVMSFIAMIFIFVPMLAPIVGQGILMMFNWQAVFVFTGLVGIISLSWYLLRQGETHPIENRKAFNWQRLKLALVAIFNDRRVIGYVICSGVISAPFLFYLSSSPQLFQLKYELGEVFPLYFAGVALVLGLSSLFNGKKVVKHGMRKMASRALKCLIVIASSFLLVSIYFDGLPPLWVTTVFLVMIFACLGLIGGNLTALTMEPLGKMAGIGAAITGCLSTLMSVSIGICIGQFFNGTTYLLALSYTCAAIIILLVFRWIKLGKDDQEAS